MFFDWVFLVHIFIKTPYVMIILSSLPKGSSESDFFYSKKKFV